VKNDLIPASPERWVHSDAMRKGRDLYKISQTVTRRSQSDAGYKTGTKRHRTNKAQLFVPVKPGL